MIKLYGVPMSRAMRSLWMLEEIGLPYENVPTHFANGDNHKPDYLALNPNGHIPTLDDDGTVVWESMAINLYLAMKYGKGLWPTSVADQGHALQWSFWAMTEIEPGLLAALMNRAVYPPDQRKPELADEGEAKLSKPLAVLNAHLATRKYLLGDTYSVADLNVAAVLAWVAFARIKLDAWPHVTRWLGENTARPAYKKATGR